MAYKFTHPMTPPSQTACSVCVMDTTDPDIAFFGDAGCSHCIRAKERLHKERFTDPRRLEQMVAEVKRAGRGRPYDCLIGISGGVDSSYVLVKAKELGLRPLAVHMDNGWNAEIAVHNIKALVEKLGIDLITYVIDWREIRALQRACFAVPLIDIEIVSDHAIFAVLFSTAAKHNIRYVFSGGNLATESILPKAWVYDKRDARHVKAVYGRYGEGQPLRTYPFLFPLKFLYYVLAKRIRFIPLLNYLSYHKPEAVAHLQKHYGWKPYANKHGESVFTRFYQDYYLPQKFGFDKRKAHYSSMIAASQMTRDEAVRRLAEPLFSPEEFAQEKSYVLKKLGYTEEEFARIMRTPAVPHRDLPNNAWMFDPRNPVTRFIRKLTQRD